MHLETAKRLVEVAGDRHIPVRCNIRGLNGKGGGEGHFSRGSLIGIDGTKLKIKPYRHGGKVEIYDPELVHIWTSRCISNGVLNQEQIDQAQHGAMPAVALKAISVEKLSKKLSLEAAVCGVVEDVADKTGIPVGDNMSRLYNLLEASSEDSAPSHGSNGNSHESSADDSKLREELEAASSAISFVVADLGKDGDDSLQFYMGKGSRDFSPILERAMIYGGDHSEANARRSLGQIVRRPDNWRGVISGPANLKVMPLDEAQELYEEIKAKRDGKSRAQEEPQPTVPKPAAKKPAAQTVEAIVEQIEAQPIPEAPDEPLLAPSAVETPAPVAQPMDFLFADPSIQEALGEIQASMTNVQTAVDMLKDERQRLIHAQETLIQKIANVVNGQLKVIDQSVAQGTATLAGRRSLG